MMTISLYISTVKNIIISIFPFRKNYNAITFDKIFWSFYLTYFEFMFTLRERKIAFENGSNVEKVSNYFNSNPKLKLYSQY